MKHTNKTIMTEQDKKDLYDLKQNGDRQSEEIKKLRSDFCAHKTETDSRLTILEDDSIRNNIIRDLTDTSKTGITNFSVFKIAERNKVSEYEVGKIQKEAGISRKGNRVSYQ